jgi:hypothetical protein
MRVAVTVDGGGPEAGVVDRAVHLWSGCNLTADSLRIRKASGHGLVVEHGAVTTLTNAKLHDNGGSGIVIRGAAHMQNGVVAFNGGRSPHFAMPKAGPGILVEASIGSTFDHVDVRDNGGSGFVVHPSVVTFTNNRIHNNGRYGDLASPTGGAGDYPQMWFFGRPGDDEPTVYHLGPQDLAGCLDVAAAPNRIYSYNTSDPFEHSVGLYAQDRAHVVANFNIFRTHFDSLNVDQASGGNVTLLEYCGSPELIADPLPGPPVE